MGAPDYQLVILSRARKPALALIQVGDDRTPELLSYAKLKKRVYFSGDRDANVIAWKNTTEGASDVFVIRLYLLFPVWWPPVIVDSKLPRRRRQRPSLAQFWQLFIPNLRIEKKKQNPPIA